MNNIEQVIRNYVPQIVHLSLGTSKDSKPWVCEVHFAYDDQLNLYFRSLTSRRHSREIAANPNVAGNIIKQHALDSGPVLGVYFDGTAEHLTNEKDQRIAADCIIKQLGKTEEIFTEAQREDGHQFYKISVGTFYVFGDIQDGQGMIKHQLRWNGGAKGTASL